jgi:hypothetical protein
VEALEIDIGTLMLVDLPIFGDQSRRQNISFDAEALVNFYQISDPRGKKKLAFLSVPGLALKKTVIESSTAESRELFQLGNRLYGVFGASVYEFDSSFLPVLIGTIGTTTGYVSFAANNANQIIIVDGQKGYIHVVGTTTLTAITDTNFPSSPTNVAFLDGFFVVPKGESTEFRVSAINDGLTWPADNFAQISAYKGNIVGVGVVNRRLYFYKDTSTEVWYNPGTPGLPFKPDRNLLFNYGNVSVASIASALGYLFWVSKDDNGVGSVMMTTGQTPTKISDSAIEETIASFTSPEDVRAYIYKDGDHIFYVLNWNTDDMTLVVDITMENNWHRMEMIKHKKNTEVQHSGKTRHLSNCHAYFNGKHYVGSYKAPILYEFSRDYGTNAGEPIRRSRTCQVFFTEGYKAMQINSIQIDAVYTHNNSVGFEVDPKIYLELSKDGGKVFGNEDGRSLGKIGNTKARALFRKKGLARQITARFSIYDDLIGIAVLGASINYEVLKK